MLIKVQSLTFRPHHYLILYHYYHIILCIIIHYSSCCYFYSLVSQLIDLVLLIDTYIWHPQTRTLTIYIPSLYTHFQHYTLHDQSHYYTHILMNHILPLDPPIDGAIALGGGCTTMVSDYVADDISILRTRSRN